MSYRLRNAAYLLSFTPAVLVIYGNLHGNWFSWLNIIYSLVLLGMIESFTGSSDANEHSAAKDPFPEMILFGHVLSHTASLYSLFFGIRMGILEGPWLIGAILSTGVAAGSSGIIVAHELIHKANPFKRFLGRYLLASTGNFYFYVHHLRIHHRDVATTQDAATARKGESLYAFFLRSVREQITQSAASEHKRTGGKSWGLNHELTKALFMVLMVALTVWWFSGITGLFSWMGMGLFANFLLEYVNYIEHYGLSRNPGTRVNEWHSWSCDKHISRFLLIDLSRHADHHNVASKPYHTLISYEQGPQLPGGYASLILPALIPQWWFRITHPILAVIEKEKAA
jgi:alkane 1-monooxygenase